jgi:peptide-methionine (S)-S-oxide reductase
MQDLIRRKAGRDLDPRRLLGRRCAECDVSQPRDARRSHRDHLRPDDDQFPRILEFFFQIHDPTTKNRQGNDIGMSYRSAIFYTSAEQKRVAEDTIADRGSFRPLARESRDRGRGRGDFWEAEPEHQDYLERIPNGYTCHFVRAGWKLPKRDDAADGRSLDA